MIDMPALSLDVLGKRKSFIHDDDWSSQREEQAGAFLQETWDESERHNGKDQMESKDELYSRLQGPGPSLVCSRANKVC